MTTDNSFNHAIFNKQTISPTRVINSVENKQLQRTTSGIHLYCILVIIIILQLANSLIKIIKSNKENLRVCLRHLEKIQKLIKLFVIKNWIIQIKFIKTIKSIFIVSQVTITLFLHQMTHTFSGVKIIIHLILIYSELNIKQKNNLVFQNKTINTIKTIFLIRTISQGHIELVNITRI